MSAPSSFLFGPYRLDAQHLTLWRQGAIIPAAPRVLAMLKMLLEAEGQAVSKAELLRGVWQEAFVEEGNLTQTAFLLRKTLGKTDDGREYVQTIPRRGYCLAVPVESLQAAFPGPQESTSLSPDLPGLPPTAGAIQDLAQAPQRVLTKSLVLWLSVGLATILAIFGSLAFYRSRLQAVPQVSHYLRLTNDGIHKEQLAPLLLVNGRVLFTEIQENRNVLASIGPNGGEVSRHAGPRDDATALSSSPETLFFGSLWAQPGERFSISKASADSPRPLVADLSAHGASWSPKRHLLAFTRGHDLLLSDGSGNSARLLAHVNGVPFWPRWSPSGDSIRFSVRQSAQSDGIYEVGPKGGTPEVVHGLDQPEMPACCGEWTPDGHYFVFVREGPRSGGLWIRSEARWRLPPSQPRPLSEGFVDFWRSPALSADGRHLFAVGETLRGELLRYDRATGQFRKFLNGISGDTLNFSRGGDWIAYTTFPEGTLWRSRADGSDRVQLTRPGEVARFPQWSPDGTEIAYIAAQDHRPWQVFIIPAAGGSPRHVSPSDVSQGAATWSPDGRKLAFGNVPSFAQSRQGSDRISIVDLASGQIEAIAGSEGTWTARWSPDGRFLAATTLDRNRLMLYDFHTATWSTAAQTGVNDLAWSADAQSLFIDATNGSNPRISVLDMRSRSHKPYVDLSGIRRTGFDGWRFSLAPNNEPILLEQAGIQEVYRLDLSSAVDRN